MSSHRAVNRWYQWAKEHLLTDIRSNDNEYPISLLTGNSWGVECGRDQIDNLRSDFEEHCPHVYILFVDDNPEKEAWKVDTIRPVYIGKSEKGGGDGNPYKRASNHMTSIQGAGSCESGKELKKYSHLSYIGEKVSSPLYFWTRPVSGITGPHGYNCYAEELEGKIAGLLHQIPSFRRTLANKGDYIPNWSRYKRNKERADWIRFDPLPDVKPSHWANIRSSLEKSKSELWDNWINENLICDINRDKKNDPIPLFQTAPESLKVHITTDTKLKRNNEIENEIQKSGQECIVNGEPISCEREGLLYIMYQLDRQTDQINVSDVKPLYIGKAGVWGKRNKLSTNFNNIWENQEKIEKSKGLGLCGMSFKTNEFARWGDDTEYHIGDLSHAVETGTNEEKHLHWAEALFEPESTRLKEQTYLWVHTWDRSEDIGPYQTTPSLPAVESQLVALAYENSPKSLLNKKGVPSEAPIEKNDPQFTPPKELPDQRDPDQEGLNKFD